MEGKENQIRLQGYLESAPEFSHRMFGEEFYACDIHVPRLSGFVDILPITLTQRLIGACEPGVWLDISGQLRSYNKAVEGANRLILMPELRGLRL